jgi:hypothetical protein
MRRLNYETLAQLKSPDVHEREEVLLGERLVSLLRLVSGK